MHKHLNGHQEKIQKLDKPKIQIEESEKQKN